MVSRYANNEDKKTFYEQASEKELREDIQRKQTMKKIIVGVGVGAAVGAGVYLAYKYGAVDRIAKAISNGDTGEMLNNIAKKAIRDSADDIGYILSKGSTLHRMNGFENGRIRKKIQTNPYLKGVSTPLFFRRK